VSRVDPLLTPYSFFEEDAYLHSLLSLNNLGKGANANKIDLTLVFVVSSSHLRKEVLIWVK
jgi:hypothetical protein